MSDVWDEAVDECLKELFRVLVDGLVTGETQAVAQFGRGVRTVRRALKIAKEEAKE